MGTSTKISFELADTTAKEDSTFSIDDKQDFVDLDDLKKNIDEVKYGTLEKNQFALDGNFKLITDNPSGLCLWSKQMSDEDGNFTTPIVLEIDFTVEHSSEGLTLTFSQTGDYCNYLNIKYYDDDENLLSNEDFYPDDYVYGCKAKVENYTKIIITFYSTNNPYRYLKLYKILYGILRTFNKDVLKSVNILEEIDMLSSEVSINTLDFEVYSDEDEFNIINPSGIYKLLQKKQKLEVEGTINNETKNMGTFYLDDWKNEKNKLMKISAKDLLGLMDKGNDFLRWNV